MALVFWTLTRITVSHFSGVKLLPKTTDNRVVEILGTLGCLFRAVNLVSGGIGHQKPPVPILISHRIAYPEGKAEVNLALEGFDGLVEENFLFPGRESTRTISAASSRVEG